MKKMVAALALLCCQPAIAQCELDWLAGAGIPGVDGSVFASTVWDADGPGPIGERVVVGGSITTAGSATVNRLACWDPATGEWSPLGSGINGSGDVVALAVMANNNLVVGGSFASIGGVPASNLVTWNGTTWSELGGGVNGRVSSLETMPNGDLVVAGSFSNAGGVPANGLARWNGTSWSQVANGATGVTNLAAAANGDLAVTGIALSVPGIQTKDVAIWNGTTWSNLDGGVFLFGFGGAQASAFLPNGDLVVGGHFTQAGGVAVNSIGRWDGTTWHAMAAGFNQVLNSSVQSLLALPNGDIIAAGAFTSTGTSTRRGIAKWNGSQWLQMGVGFPNLAIPFSSQIYTLARTSNGDVIAGGDFTSQGGQPGEYVSRWDGNTWTAMGGDAGVGGSVSGPVICATYTSADDLIIGGSFGSVAGVITNNLARRDGQTWTSMGGGVTHNFIISAEVYDLLEMPNGDIIVGGRFIAAGGVPASNIARWNGATWQPLGAGAIGSVHTMALLPNGDVIASGQFVDSSGGQILRVGRWDGSSWSSVGDTLNAQVNDLHVSPAGELFAAGNFSMAGATPVNRFAVLNGNTWSPVGAGSSGVLDMTNLPNGDLLVNGSPGIRKWDGTSWSTFATTGFGGVSSLVALPDGDVIASGNFTTIGGVAANHIAHFDGLTWRPLGSGIDLLAQDLALRSTGEVAVAGAFTQVNGSVSANLALLDTPCAAAVADAGSGCASSGGQNELRATTLAWTGGSLQVAGEGLPGTCLVAIVTGFHAGVTSLPAVIAQGQPGCTMHLQPAFCDWTATTTGAMTWQTPIPVSPLLAGQSFLHQLIVVETTAGNIAAVTASNALALTIGAIN